MNAENYQLLAEYNTWMNAKLYEVCAGLSDALRKTNKGGFFGSIHGTLNHILLGDRVWMGRFEDKPYAVTTLDAELFSDFDELRGARREEDARIERWVRHLSDATLKGYLSYQGIVNPAPRRYVYWHAVTHFFNHQTHHRGQLTTLLSQADVAYGVTDMIGMPGVDRSPS